MKYIKFLWLFALIATMACSDDFLVLKPNDSLDASKVDVSNIQGLRTQVYDLIPKLGTYMETYSDNAYARNSWDGNGRLYQTNTITAGDDAIDYGEHYDLIRKCNLLISKMAEFELDPEIEELYMAEARVFRAWRHTQLTLIYGDIVIADELINDLPEGIARTDKKVVWEWIMTELDEAIAILPVENDPGKLNKAQGYAIQAFAAYYLGEYAVAEKAAKYVIDNGGYSLFEVTSLSEEENKEIEFYKTLVDFEENDIDEEAFMKGMYNFRNIWFNDENTEVIIKKEFLPLEDFCDFDRFAVHLTPHLTDRAGGWNTHAPMQELANAFWSIDGKSDPVLPSLNARQEYYDALRGEVQAIQDAEEISYNAAVATIASDLHQKDYLQEYRNRDSRLYGTLLFPFVNVETLMPDAWNQYIYLTNNFGETGYVWKKFGGAAEDQRCDLWGSYGYQSGNDWHTIRLAEMLLIYAEARTHNAGYDASAVAELNKLRVRCGMPNVPEGLSKTDALDFIRRERRIELAGEGRRWFDIRLYEDPMRNGNYKGKEAASKVMTGTSYDIQANEAVTKIWNSRLLYHPIPTTARDKNPLLDQNDGY